MSVAAIGAVDYAKALDGLSLKQAQLMLTTQGIVGEEQKDLLVKQGLIATSDRMSASLVSEALANNGLNKEKVEEILIDANLMSQNTKELITENAVTEAKLRAVLAEKGIKGAKADTLVTSILQTGQNAKEAISWDVLAASIKKSMIALAQNPLTWIAVAVGAVVGFIKIVDHFAVTAEKLNEQLQELKATEEELISTQDKLTEIDGKIAEIQSKETLSITDKADISRLEQEKLLLKDEIELLKLRKELQQDEYNKNAKKYADGEYSNYTRGQGDITHLMNSYKGYKAKSERTDIDDYFIEDAKRGLKETEAELIEYRNTINENLANLAPDDEESRKKLETIREAIEKLIYTEEELAKIKFDRFIIDPNNTGISEGFEKIKSDGEVAAQEITDLASKFPTLKRFMDDNGVSAETLAAELNNVGTEAENSDGNVDKMTDSWQSLSDALKGVESAYELFNEVQKDFNSTGAISSENIQKILSKFPELEDELYEYIMGMRSGASVMDLLKTKSDDMATTSADAFRRMYLSSNSVSKDMKKQFGDTFEAVGLGWDNTQSVMANVNSQIIDANGNVTTTFSTQWANACANAGASVSAFAQGLSTLFSGGIDNIEVKNGVLYSKAADGGTANLVNTSAHKILNDLNEKGQNSEYWDTYGSLVSFGNDGKVTQASRDSVWNAINKSYWGQYNANVKNQEEFERKQKEFEERMKQLGTSTDSSSSSSKNSPDYEDPTDAIINRINLRSKELEQQEESIQDAIEIAELENDYKKQVSLTNDKLDIQRQKVNALKTANDELHQMAEDLRNSTPDWNEEEWFDSQGNATEAYNTLYNNSSKEDQEKIKDQFEKISKIKKAWAGNADEIVAINKEILQSEEDIWDTRRQIFDDRLKESEDYIEHSNNFGWENGDSEVKARKRVLDWIESDYYRSLIEDDGEYYDILAENRLKYIEAQKKEMEEALSDIDEYINERNSRDDWDEYADSEIDAINRQIKIVKKYYRNGIISLKEYKDQIADLNQAIYDAHIKEMENALSDIDEYINERNSRNDWDEYTDNEIDAIRRKMDTVEEYYKNGILSLEKYNDKIKDLNLELYNAQVNELDNSLSDIDEYINERNSRNDWDEYTDNEVNAIRRKMDTVEEYYKNGILSLEEYNDRIKDLNLELYNAQVNELDNSLSDIDDYINERNSRNDWDEYADSEIDAIHRKMDEVQKYYDNGIISLEEYNDRIAALSQNVYDAHIRAMDGALSDIDEYISARNTYNDWDEYADNEISAIRRKMDVIKEYYDNGIISLEEYNDRIADLDQSMYSTAKNMLFESIEKELSAYEEAKNEEKESLNLQSSQYGSLKTLLQSYYDVINGVKEAQHEITKELEASKTMYEYLNEDTRKLLFNQEDYNVLNEKLLGIQDEANRLQEQYNNDILSASKENIEEITSQYQIQYETLMKSYEIAKADLEVAKKKQQLDNTLKERNVRMFINGSWQWVANTQDVQNAQNELADALYEQEKAKDDLSQTGELNSLQSAQDSIATQLSYIDKDIEDFREQWKDIQEQINGEVQDFTDVLNAIISNNIPVLGDILEETSGVLKEFVGNITMDTNRTAYNMRLENLIPINQHPIVDIGQMADLQTLWNLNNIRNINPIAPSLTKNMQEIKYDNSIHINGITISEQGNEDWINGLKRFIATH